MQTLESMISSSQGVESKHSIMQTLDSTGPISQGLHSMDTAVQPAPEYEDTIPPVFNYKSASQDNSSALRPAPLPARLP